MDRAKQRTVPEERPVIDRKARLAIPEQTAQVLAPAERRRTWEEICLGYTLSQATTEATRCLQCPAAPCQKACPLQNDIPGALALLSAGDVDDAGARFRATSPFPDICARVCPQERLCEGACVLGKRGAPIRIGLLERFATDQHRTTVGLSPLQPAASTGRTVAIVGAGPAGLAAAEDIRQSGHRVVLFDAWSAPGGTVRYGIPPFKLPPDLMTAKWDQLAAAGVVFEGQVYIDDHAGLAALQTAGFDAILLASGALTPHRLGLPGEDLRGVWAASDFLIQATHPEAWRSPMPDSERVVVIGGGDTAMDCSRVAVRLGAAEVLCVYRRSEAEMRARRVEYAYAQEEGVRFEFLAAPTRLWGEDGALRGVECTRMALGDREASGRRRVIPVPNETFEIPTTMVIVAVGYHVGVNGADAPQGIARRAEGTILADPHTGATTMPGVFAAGDATSGPDLVVTAVAAGRRAAAGIMAYLADKEGA